MDNEKLNSHSTDSKKPDASDTATQKAGATSHFRRKLVPIDEYATRQGISSDIVEKQGKLGVIQIRKYRGRQFVVDVPPEQLDEFEKNTDGQIPAAQITTPSTKTSRLITTSLITVLVIIIISVSWLYIDTKQKLDDLNAEYTSTKNLYDKTIASGETAGLLENELAGSRKELAGMQNRIAASKTELERIQSDLSKARRNLESVQSQISDIQAGISLSRVEIEGIQNNLKQSRTDLDKLSSQNSETSEQ